MEDFKVIGNPEIYVKTLKCTLKWKIGNYSKIKLDETDKSPEFSVEHGSIWCLNFKKQKNVFLLYLYRDCPIVPINMACKVYVHDIEGKECYMTKNEYLVECTKYYVDIAINSNYQWSHTLNSFNEVKNDTLFFTVLIEVSYSGGNGIDNYFEDDKLATETLQYKLLRTLSGDLQNILNRRTKPDLVLSAQEQKINVNRDILSARSPVFEKMLNQSAMNETEHIVDIDDVKMPVLKELVAFMYSAQLKDYDFQTALELYLAADKYEILELREICARVLLSKLTIDNTPKVLILADVHQDVALKEKVMQFVKTNYNSKNNSS